MKQAKNRRRDQNCHVARVAPCILLLLLPLSCLNRPVATRDPKGFQRADLDKSAQKEEVDGFDLLFVIDDSLSMADKQEVLRVSLDRVQGSNPEKAIWPAARSVAIISTSLEAAGACTQSSRGAAPVYFAARGQRADPSPDPAIYIPHLTDAGEQGCGYEAPLEAMYRS